MKNKILLSVVVFLSVLLLMVLNYAKKNNYMIPIEPINPAQSITVRLLNEEDGSITNINLEDYIVGVVAAEMPASFHMEALKAQAVAARTFAMYKIQSKKEDYDLVIGVKDQAYKDNKTLLGQWGLSFFTNYLKIRDAVKSTQNEIITYQNETINAFYFSMSNGYTEKSELVFKRELPYLRSVTSSWDNESLNNYVFNKTFSKSDFCQALGISCDKLDVDFVTRSETHRVNEISINGVVFKGTDFRVKLGLRSTDFDIQFLDDTVDITTRGFGHGVGMSQYGANGMARDGYSYQDILTHYYQNTEIRQINV